MDLGGTLARASRLLLALALVALAALAVGAGSASAAPVACPNTFHVLHNDHVGKLKLPEGHYTLTVLDDQRISCSHAATLFTKFLEDFDGKLPGNWRVIVRLKEFRRGHSDVGFSVAKGSHSGHGGGHHPSGSGKVCPGTFQVLHNDRIGRLKLPAGKYMLTRLTKTSPSCSQVSDLFARFLERPEGNLPAAWRLEAKTGTFIRRGTPRGFRVKPAS
jgi:hypothetical protein